MLSVFIKPSTLDRRVSNEADDVPRDKLDRPRIWVPEKKKLMSYTRVTTFIDCLDDKTGLDRWDKRNVLVGATRAPHIITETAEMKLDPTDKADKGKLDKAVAKLVAIAGAHEKADRGTWLHNLSQYVDRGEPLPPCSPEDLADMAAYKAATVALDVVKIEKLVVLDEYKVAGTPDRLTYYDGTTPDGVMAGNVITDLKTGTTEYGALKMAMQLALYSRGLLYDWRTQERSPMPNVNQEWGLIIHLPAGTAQPELLWVDLTVGWAGVQLAREVRAMRNKNNKKLFKPFVFAPRVSVSDLTHSALASPGDGV